MGRETHTGRGGGVRRGRVGAPYPRAAGTTAFLGLACLLKQFRGVALAEDRVFGSWFSFLSAPGWVRRPGCHPALDPEFPHFTFH